MLGVSAKMQDTEAEDPGQADSATRLIRKRHGAPAGL